MDTELRNRNNLELRIFTDHPGYKMNVAAYSNNLGAALKILLSGHSVVPMPPSYIQSLGLKNVRKLNIETRTPVIREDCVVRVGSEKSLVSRHFMKMLTTSGDRRDPP